MSRRYELRSIFDKNFFYNKSILYSILISIVAVLFVTHIPGVNTFLGYSSISFNSWITIFVAGLLFLMTHETLKVIKRKKLKD